MCGLVAMIVPWNNGFTALEIEQFKIAMFANQLRGTDSTGVALVTKNGDVTFEKTVGGWPSLLMSKKYDKIDTLMLNQGVVTFGHGRLATRGDKIEEHAHPFERRKLHKKHKIVMVHNGTLLNHQSLPGFSEFKVDSEWLADQIALLGPDEAFSKINGAIACMWYDTETKKFYAYRNYERPLYVVRLKDGAFYLNSADDALWWLKYKYRLEFHDEPKLLTPDFVYSWDIKDVREFSRTMVPVREYNYPVVTHHYPNPHLNPVVSKDGRTVQSDMKDVERFHTTTVTFDKGDRITDYLMGNRRVIDKGVAPYEHYLYQIRMWDKADNVVEKVYQTNTGGTRWNSLWTVEKGLLVLYKPTGKETLLNTTTEPSLNEGRSLITVPYKAGKVIKFTTVIPINGTQTTVTHKAACSHDTATCFDWYENNIDGKVKVGERIKMEICHIIPTDTTTPVGKRVSRVLGFRLGEKQDQTMDVSFFTDKWTDLELAKMNFFEGTVAFVSVTLAKQYELTKSYINIRLTDVVYLGSQYEQTEKLYH